LQPYHIGNVLWPKTSHNNGWHERKYSAEFEEYFPDDEQCRLARERESVHAALSQIAESEHVCCQASVPKEQDGERHYEHKRKPPADTFMPEFANHAEKHQREAVCEQQSYDSHEVESWFYNNNGGNSAYRDAVRVADFVPRPSYLSGRLRKALHR
jgi:hypothetical protein